VPISHTLEEMVQKYTAKMNPTQAGTRYGNSKTIAVNRYMEGVYPFFALTPRVKNLIENLGVPPALEGIYLAFAYQLEHYARKHTGISLQDVVAALQQEFVTLGADPGVLSQLANLVVG